MSRRIIKKIGGDRLGSGNKMTVSAQGYGYSTHDVSKVRRTSMSFGTIVPMYMWMMTTGSRLRLKMDALITSNALLYQLYGSAKFQLDVFSARMALYNPKMLLNLNDQGYDIKDIKFPQMVLQTSNIKPGDNPNIKQINPSSLLRYLGISANGQRNDTLDFGVEREHNAMWLLMYYQIVKEYYANKQEGRGYIIHQSVTPQNVTGVNYFTALTGGTAVPLAKYPAVIAGYSMVTTMRIEVAYTVETVPPIETIRIILDGSAPLKLTDVFNNVQKTGVNTVTARDLKAVYSGRVLKAWDYRQASETPIELREWDLKAVDRMQMKIMSEVETATAIKLDKNSEFPYGANFAVSPGFYAVTTSQNGLAVGTYQSDVFNNWLDNETINNLNNKSKVKVDANGEFTIDALNLTQKLYNYDQRIAITDGTLDEWRELTYAEVGKSKSLKPVYEGGLSKEIVFDMIVSTAGTEEDPLGTIASRGQFGSKHKGGYAQIEGDEEKLVMVLAKITPRLVYNQGNDWTTNLKTLDDLHKPVLDKIGYQNLLTDQMAAWETRINDNGTLVTFSAGKQPAWQWYRTNYDDALGNMADTEDYKVFGREYESNKVGDYLRIKDLTTYIDPRKFNDVFALKSLDAMNFDVQVGIDATLTLVMSEEVVPNL